MYWIGLAFVGVVLVAMWALVNTRYYRLGYRMYKSLHDTAQEVIKLKEKRITSLKYALKETLSEKVDAEQMAFDQAKELCEKDKQIEAQQTRIEELSKNVDTKTPDWYKAKYLELIQEVSNEKHLIKLLEEANSIYRIGIKERDEELDTAISDLAVANKNLEAAWEKIDTLEKDLKDYMAAVAFSMPEQMPAFSQVGIPVEEKSNEAPY